MNRRQFLKTSAATGGAAILIHPASGLAQAPAAAPEPIPAESPVKPPASKLPNLEPARWIWYPSGRTLPNTFILFRKECVLAAPPKKAVGWIAADSRYRLEVNGRRVQWGPAPADPRWPEADPVDLTELLTTGKNVLGATVLYYGSGDGTSPIGKPGFLFRLEIEHADGTKETIVSDPSWQALLCRAWAPGHYKRWYLRALQEEFDARLYPQNWSAPQFTAGPEWLPAMPLGGSPNRPALSTGYYEYMTDIGGGPANSELRPRSVPMLRETLVPVARLTETLRLEWTRSLRDYFDFRTPNAFTATRDSFVKESAPGVWTFNPDGTRSAALTFEFAEQVVGWPGFTIEAPEGTEIEMLVHEAHQPGGPALINSHFDSWTRFTCRAGVNEFETFDYESLRWLQLHIHNATGPVTVRDIRVRRRLFPWPHTPKVRVGEPALQRLMDASVNTLNNCAQETLVDGMARERQQYSGDCGHQIHALQMAFGETTLSSRYLTTWSQGLTKDGFFLDCWPAWDRMARLMERQLDLSGWGPILDHGVGFNFDCWNHYLYTGNREAIQEPYPRLLRFAEYLRSLAAAHDGLLPVENLGIPSVWIDHVAYRQQREKRCAFNLYAAAAMRHALAPLCRVFGETEAARRVEAFGDALLEQTRKTYWSAVHGLFVNNLPWLAEEKSIRCCDRSLATAILFDQCPEGKTTAALQMLANAPANLGISYPANACWRYWALCKGGRTDILLKDLRERWATMPSVLLNNTLQEDWHVQPDSGGQWSHCPVVPLYMAYQGLAGIRPLAPGFARVELRPEPADLKAMELTVHTVRGPIHYTCTGERGNRELKIALPEGCEGELLLRRNEKTNLPPISVAAPEGYVRLAVSSGKSLTIKLTDT
jgi:hypothetical protein